MPAQRCIFFKGQNARRNWDKGEKGDIEKDEREKTQEFSYFSQKYHRMSKKYLSILYTNYYTKWVTSSWTDGTIVFPQQHK